MWPEPERRARPRPLRREPGLGPVLPVLPVQEPVQEPQEQVLQEPQEQKPQEPQEQVLQEPQEQKPQEPVPQAQVPEPRRDEHRPP